MFASGFEVFYSLYFYFQVSQMQHGLSKWNLQVVLKFILTVVKGMIAKDLKSVQTRFVGKAKNLVNKIYSLLETPKYKFYIILILLYLYSHLQ